MNQHTVTVYKLPGNAFRVVRGDHKPTADARVTVYPSASVAYAAETNGRIRNALLQIDPNAAKRITCRMADPRTDLWATDTLTELADVTRALQELNAPRADRRYSYVQCATCNHYFQRIDFHAGAHIYFCSDPRMVQS